MVSMPPYKVFYLVARDSADNKNNMSYACMQGASGEVVMTNIQISDSVCVAIIVSSLTLGAHAPEGYGSWELGSDLCVCVSVCL